MELRIQVENRADVRELESDAPVYAKGTRGGMECG